MIARLLELLFGLKWCSKHDQWRRSDFCGKCMTMRGVREGTVDRAPAWFKSEGSWPVARRRDEEKEMTAETEASPLRFRRRDRDSAS